MQDETPFVTVAQQRSNSPGFGVDGFDRLIGKGIQYGAARGEDPLLHKKQQWLRPIDSPIGAIDLRNSTGGFTLGGLMTSLSGEVLHVDGEPIPGLFAAGRCTAGLAA